MHLLCMPLDNYVKLIVYTVLEGIDGRRFEMLQRQAEC